ncbi:MAG: helix-turn-helix transcriptional regulator [Roseburia sp.]|nr:helix-turn-helix transcriptional regulator [Roseburia sp.]
MMNLSPFWEMLSRRGISTYDLEYKYDINPAEISRLKNNHNFTLSTIDRYCELFDCRIEDIVIHIHDTRKKRP